MGLINIKKGCRKKDTPMDILLILIRNYYTKSSKIHCIKDITKEMHKGIPTCISEGARTSGEVRGGGGGLGRLYIYILLGLRPVSPPGGGETLQNLRKSNDFWSDLLANEEPTKTM